MNPTVSWLSFAKLAVVDVIFVNPAVKFDLSKIKYKFEKCTLL